MDFTRQIRLVARCCTLLAFTIGGAAVPGQQNNPQPATEQQADRQQQGQQTPPAQPQAGQQPNQAPQENKQPGQTDETQKKPQPRELKVFELQHRNPAEIQQLLGMRRAPLGRQGSLGGASRPQQLEEGPVAAVAGDADSKALFVRGTAQQIQAIEEIVKVVDVPADQFKAQTIGDKHLIPISGDGNNSQRVLHTLSQLQLPHQVVQLGDGAWLVLSDDGSGEFQSLIEQTQQVITALQKSPQKPGAEQQPNQNAADGPKAAQQPQLNSEAQNPQTRGEK